MGGASLRPTVYVLMTTSESGQIWQYSTSLVMSNIMKQACFASRAAPKIGAPVLLIQAASDPASKKLPSIRALTRTRGVQKGTDI